ncbi:MAG: hypothetical protein ACREAI_07005 [Nitrososphaera sp.]
MCAVMDSRKEKALLDAIRTISRYLGKEDEFQSFIAYTSFAEENKMNPSLDEISRHTPGWIRIVSPPLIKLYDSAYENGYVDANELWHPKK